MQQISRLRKEKGLSMYRLAQISGVSEPAIRKWESAGIEHAEYSSVAKVARALEVQMEDLDDGEGR